MNGNSISYSCIVWLIGDRITLIQNEFENLSCRYVVDNQNGNEARVSEREKPNKGKICSLLQLWVIAFRHRTSSSTTPRLCDYNHIRADFSLSRSLSLCISTYELTFRTHSIWMVGSFGINGSLIKKKRIKRFWWSPSFCATILCCWEITERCVMDSLWYMETKWTRRMCNERVDCQTSISVCMWMSVCVWECVDVCMWESVGRRQMRHRNKHVFLYTIACYQFLLFTYFF